MPRPASKPDLLQLSEGNFNKLNDYINSFSKKDQNTDFPKGTLNRNIRDVLAHLHHWHLMFLDWYKIGMKGEKPHMPAKGYTWKDNAALNKAIRQKYSKAGLASIRRKLNESHNAVQKIIKKHSNEELFEKKRYHWTGSTSIGAYLVGSTSSHYDWAYKLIRKCKKASLNL